MTTITKNSIPSLEQFGNMPEAYRHHDRWCRAGETLVLSTAVLKWYEIGRPGIDIPAERIAEARQFLIEESQSGRLDLLHGLGFAELHDCAGITFLIIGVWQGHNELWKAGYDWLPDHPEKGYFPAVREGLLQPMLCVWELTPVWHERNAWSRYLLSARDEAAKRAYIEDVYEGEFA